MDKHLKSLAPKHVDTKFIKLDAEVNVLELFYTCIEPQCLLWLYNLECLVNLLQAYIRHGEGRTRD